MKFLILFLISFNLLAAEPVFKLADSVKAVCACSKNNAVGVVTKIWTGDAPMYLVEFLDGIDIPLDENELTLNP